MGLVSSWRRLVVAVAMLATGAAASVMVVAAPASAHKDGTCNNGDICLWSNSGYSGGFIDYAFSDSDFTNDSYFVYPGTVNDTTSSAGNYNYGCQARLFKDTGYGGGIIHTFERRDAAGWYDSDFSSPFWDNYNDKASSFNWYCG